PLPRGGAGLGGPQLRLLLVEGAHRRASSTTSKPAALIRSTSTPCSVEAGSRRISTRPRTWSATTARTPSTRVSARSIRLAHPWHDIPCTRRTTVSISGSPYVDVRFHRPPHTLEPCPRGKVKCEYRRKRRPSWR